MGAITLTGVTKHFGDFTAVADVDLSVGDGEFVVFVGPSGCGKSTLLRLIAGLEDVSAGRVAIDGVDATATPPAKRELAMVFQSYALYPHMSVANNIAFPLKMAGLDSDAIAAKVNAAAATLNLSDYLHRRPGQLSGGQRQRVAIGRAIVREPKAFLFDEPLSNLDAALRVNMRIELGQLHQSLRATMIYVTHDQVEAMTMADKIVVLNAGRIEQIGTPLQLYTRPANTFVAGFIGSPKMNLLGGDFVHGFDAHTIGVRPEHIHLSHTPPAGGAWHGIVAIAEHLGSDTFLYASVDGVTVTVRAPGEFAAAPGDKVYLTPADEHIHRFNASGEAV